MFEFENHPFEKPQENRFELKQIVSPTVNCSVKPLENNFTTRTNNFQSVYAYNSESLRGRDASTKENTVSKFWLFLLITGFLSLLGYIIFKKYWALYEERILAFIGIEREPEELEERKNV
jgi:hypothetical protein